MEEKNQELTWLPHILGLFTWIIGPLVMYLTSEENSQVKEHSKKAFNWQLSFMIYFLILGIVFFAGVFLTMILIGFVIFPIAALMMFALGILDLVFCIMATVKASNGELWNYPLTIPFLR